MKTFSKLTIVIVAAAAMAATSSSRAQIKWNFSDGDAVADQTVANLGTPVLSRGNNIGSAALISSTSPSDYPGASKTNNAGAATHGGALDPSTSTFFEFTITPDAGFAVTANGFSLGSRATATGPTTLTLRSSLDGFVANLAIVAQSTTSTWTVLTLSPFSVTGAPSTPLTFRLYGSGGTATTSTTVNWRIDDLSFSAQAIVPEPSVYMLLGVGLLLCGQRFLRRKSA